MNETIRLLFERKSVRVYTGQKISDENKNLILDAAIQAPTAGNMHLYSIIDITDRQIIDRLAINCDHQAFIAQAAMVLIFCADYQRTYDGFALTQSDISIQKPRVGDLLLACNDAIIAAQNAVMAASSLGIGSCYIGDILENTERNTELLHLPAFVLPITMLVFGYPTQQQIDRKKPARIGREFIVHENRYQQMDANQYENMIEAQSKLAGTPAVSVNNYYSDLYKRKYQAAFTQEMNRSADVMIKKWTHE